MSGDRHLHSISVGFDKQLGGLAAARLDEAVLEYWEVFHSTLLTQ